jgi:hypothetical protein
MRQHPAASDFPRPGEKACIVIEPVDGLCYRNGHILQYILGVCVIAHAGVDITIQGSPVLHEQPGYLSLVHARFAPAVRQEKSSDVQPPGNSVASGPTI